MYIFHRPYYVSEATQFLGELKTKDPQVEARQLQGRALLWNKAVDRDAWRGFDAAEVSQQPYVYQTAPK